MNGRCARHADSPEPVDKGGGTPGNRNAVGHGAPEGNQNARTHGLFAAGLSPSGRVVYEQAQDLAPDELARQAANFVSAKVVEVYSATPQVRGAIARVEEFLDELVEADELSFEGKTFIMRRLTDPDIASLGKALGPLKGLLEVKQPKASDAGTNALQSLAEVIARSQARRDAEGQRRAEG